MKPITKTKIEKIDRKIRKLNKLIRQSEYWHIKKWKLKEVKNKPKYELKRLLNIQAGRLRYYKAKVQELRWENMCLLKENRRLLG